MATDLAKLVVSLEAETAKYHKELERARSQLDKFASQSKVAATAAGVAIGQFAVDAGRAVLDFGKRTIDAADDLSKLSQSTGIAVESLSQLQYAADLSGTSQEDLSAALGRLNKAAVNAGEGAKEQAAAFKSLGVAVTGANGQIKPAEQLLTEVAEAFSQFEDGPAKSALAMDIFGKSGARLIPFLNNGAKGLAALRAEASAFGLTVTEEAAKAAEEFNDNLTRLQRASQGVVIQMTQELLPALTAISEASVEFSKDSDAAARVTAGLAVAFKSAVAAGAAVAIVIGKAGQKLGGLLAQADAIAHFNFGDAARIGVMMAEDSAAADAQLTKFIGHLFDAKGEAAGIHDAMAKWAGVLKASKTGTLDDQRGAMMGLAAAYQAGEFGAIGTAEATRAYEAAIAKALPGIAKKTLALRSVGDAAKGAKSKIDDLLSSLRLEANTLGMSAEASELYKLKAAGATEAQLAFARAVLDGKAAFDQQRTALEAGASVTEQLRTPTEAYGAELARLDDLLQRSAISQETFNRAVVGAQSALVAADPEMQKAIEQHRRLNELLAATPTGQAEGRRQDLQLLVDDYMRNRDAIDASSEATRKYGEAFQAAVGDMPAKIEEATDLMKELSAEAARNIQGSLADFLFDPFGDSTKDMGDQFAAMLRRMAAEAASAKIMEALGLGKGGTDFLGNLATSAAGGWAGTQAPAPVSEAAFTPIPGRAGGGGMRAGMPYWVGEEGPELVFAGATSRILSTGDSAEYMRGGGRNIQQVFNIQAPDPNAFRASERQIARRARQGLGG